MADCFFFYTSKYTVWNWCTCTTVTLVVLYSFRPAAGCQTSDTDVKLTFVYKRYKRGGQLLSGRAFDS